MQKRLWVRAVLDLLVLFFSFCASILFKGSLVKSYLDNYAYPLLIFSAIWIVSSFALGKYIFEDKRFRYITRDILIANLITLSAVAILMYLLREFRFSRTVLFGTFGIATAIELGVGFLLRIFVKTITIEEPEPSRRREFRKEQKESAVQAAPADSVSSKPYTKSQELFIKRAIIEELGRDGFCFVSESVDLFVESTLVMSTTTLFNIESQPNKRYNAIVNLKRVNDIRYINKFFEAVNSKIPKGGFFLCRAETKDLRKKRILSKFPPVLNYIYYTFDYIIKRVFPKFGPTKGIYFFLTRGENRVISRAELLGRLYSCGFGVAKDVFINGSYYVLAVKQKQPAFDLEPTYGPLIKLKRVGKEGKIIKVYKMRTMHPYAEYLQEYVFEKNALQEGGKFKNDFRVSTIGKLMRKLWLDELPMFINLFKGDVKIVGVRPLSQHYFSLYTPELQQLRIKHKPGLIPPFYVDNPKTLEEIMESERKYLEQYEKHPFRTDIKYFFLAIYNIVIKHYRSN